MLYKFAKRYIGKDVSPTQGELGCVESVAFILKEYGITFKESLSTIRFDQELQTHPLFKEIKKPELGCIIISITRNRNKVGHIGWVVENNRIISNDSPTSLFKNNYSLWAWHWKYKKLKGLETKYYRYLEDKHIEQLEKQVRTLSEVVVNLANKVILLLTSKLNMKYLGSSANPAKISATVKGIGIWLIPALIFGAGYLGLNVVEGDLLNILDQTARAIGSIMVIFGIFRKIAIANKKAE